MDENELEQEQIEEIKDIPEDELDTTDWKAEALKNAGIAKRYKTKYEKSFDKKEEKPLEKAIEKESKKEFDYAEKAFLKASGINSDEFGLVLDVMQNTGKKIDDILESKYFQAELKERRDAQKSKEAIPEGTKRSGGSAKDTVEYWITKGELPPVEEYELRRQVVNAKIKAKTQSSKFTDRPYA